LFCRSLDLSSSGALPTFPDEALRARFVPIAAEDNVSLFGDAALSNRYGVLHDLATTGKRELLGDAPVAAGIGQETAGRSQPGPRSETAPYRGGPQVDPVGLARLC
jgi:hypothetical protein